MPIVNPAEKIYNERIMTISEALLKAAKKLAKIPIDSSRLDAEILLGFVLKQPREYLLAHGEKRLLSIEQKRYSLLIVQRAKFEPIAYLIGAREFYGLNLKVNKHVLIPRQESEQLVDLALQAANSIKQPKFIDVGCGSGAIALALKNKLPKAKILAFDNSASALALARINARNLHLKIDFIKSDLLSKAPQSWLKDSIMVVNLPYVAENEITGFPRQIKLGLAFEPASAIFAPENGTKIYKRLFAQLSDLPESNRPAVIMAEIGSYHHKKFLQLSNKYFVQAEISLKKDYSGRPRFLSIEL